MNLAVVLPTSNTRLVHEREKDYSRIAGRNTCIVVAPLGNHVPEEADPGDVFLLPEILQKVIEMDCQGMDAVIVDCMEDPGVEEARCLVSIPVIGPGEAALRMAVMLGFRFSILYPLQQMVLIEKLVERLGLSSFLASIRYLGVGLEGVKTDDSATFACLLDTAREAIIEDRAHVLVPACTLTSSMTYSLQEQLSSEGLKIPVVDGVAAAVKLAESLVELGLSFSRVRYPAPLGIRSKIE